MKNTTPKTMRDSSGQDIPVKYVSKYDRARDAQQDWAMVKLDIADCWPEAATE